jgi:hypothetical protein
VNVLNLIFLVVGKFVPPPVSPIVLARETEKSQKQLSAERATQFASSKATPKPVQPVNSDLATGWRRPSFSAEATTAAAPAPASAFPQRKVPALLPEIGVLEAAIHAAAPTVSEPFADFPRLPGMRAPVSAVVEKRLSLISDEASWLDGDEVDYSQQLFTDSENIFSSMEKFAKAIEAVAEDEDVKVQEAPRKIVILKRPPVAAKLAAIEEENGRKKPLPKTNPQAQRGKEATPIQTTKPSFEAKKPAVRSFKTANARERESKHSESTYSVSSASACGTTEPSTPVPTASSPIPAVKKIVYSSKSKTKTVIEK